MSAPIITRDIPIPPSARVLKGGFNKKYPWDLLDIGDSFTVPLKSGRDLLRQQNSIRNCAKNRGLRVVTRAEGNDLRVWRVE